MCSIIFLFFKYFEVLTKKDTIGGYIIKSIIKTNSRLSNLVLSNLRRYRDLTDTLEGHNSKTMSQKNFMRLQLESSN